MALRINEEIKKLLGEDALKALEEALKNTNAVLEPQENFIPRARLDEANNQLKELKANNSKLSKDLEDAVKNSKSTEELQTTIQKLQEENKTAQEKYESDIRQRERDYLINDSLRAAGARNPKAVKALLDIDSVKILDGKLDGFEKQLEELKKSDTYLFEATDPNPSPNPRTKFDKFGTEIKENGGGSDLSEAESIAIEMGVDPSKLKS